MKRYFLIIFSFLIFLGYATTQETPPELVGLSWDTFALVEDGTVRFFGIGGRGWEELEERRIFTFSSDFEKVVFLDLVNLGVITGNRLRFFHYTFQTGWKEIESRALILPDNYDSVIGLDIGAVGVIRGNTLIYYQSIQPWMERLSREFTLPEGFVSVVGLEPNSNEHDIIGVIVGNRLKHFVFDFDNWYEIEYMEFILLANYSSVIGFSYGRIGVVVDNILKYYEYFGDHRGWGENEWYRFNLQER